MRNTCSTECSSAPGPWRPAPGDRSLTHLPTRFARRSAGSTIQRRRWPRARSPRTVANDLRWATPNLVGRTTVSLEEAPQLLHVYQAVESYRAFAGLPAALVAEDEARRYVIETNVALRTPDRATVCAVVVRPRRTRERLPALLQFTIYADSVTWAREALLAAANGYVGITAHTRGKACSPDVTEPYAHDGVDAAAVIDWIAAQPWSDGRVGMYGGSYSGFTAWAVAKHAPKALKAIMVGAPVGPGIDVPMEGNVFLNFLYPWPFYTTNNRWLDNATYNDNGRWQRLNREWYRSGRPYRELEEIDGTPNPIFAQWLAHPALDAYWDSTIPQARSMRASPFRCSRRPATSLGDQGPRFTISCSTTGTIPAPTTICSSGRTIIPRRSGAS